MNKGALFFSLFLFVSLAHSRELIIAINNPLKSSSSLDAMARSQMLMTNMKIAGVPQAMFLVKNFRLTTKNKERLALYSNKGHLLVNAGHGQSLAARASLYAHEVGILKVDRLLTPFTGYKKQLHFSYLHEYGDRNIQQGLITFLNQRGFSPVFIGFNPLRGVDAYIDQLYQQKIRSNRSVNMEALEQAYVDLIADSVNVQDALWYGLLGYSPRQVLVLEENDLAAYFIIPLIDKLNAQGWQIIVAEDAFKNPLANLVAVRGWTGNSFYSTITRLPDTPVIYARTHAAYKSAVEIFLEKKIPGFTQ
jgi:hypothetical protein